MLALDKHAGAGTGQLGAQLPDRWHLNYREERCHTVLACSPEQIVPIEVLSDQHSDFLAYLSMNMGAGTAEK